MRKVLSFIFTIMYATMSSGAPSLLHYCAHEEAVHLSVGEHDHQEVRCCSEVMNIKGCDSQENALHHTPEEDDCCANTYIDLDFSEQESKLVHQTVSALSSVLITVQHHSLAPFRPTTRFLQINGPPLFILFQKLTIYGWFSPTVPV